MLYNQESVGELAGKVQYLSHVHISEPMLAPVKGRKLHQELADRLRAEGYDRFVSIEMGQQKDLTVIEDALRDVKEVFGWILSSKRFIRIPKVLRG